VTTVRTVQLAAVASVAGGPVLLYTAPSGLVVVATDIRMTYGVNLLAGSGDVRHQPSGAVVASFSDDNTDGLNTVQYQGRVVLEPGDQLYAETGGGYEVDFFVSGFTLTLP
jgi:hypothetical protein